MNRQQPGLNFDSDVGDRIVATLSHTRLRGKLEPAARLAGRQLELMKPAIMVPTHEGLWAGAVANVPLGQMVFVFADQDRVATFSCGLRAGATAITAIDQMVAEAGDAGQPEGGWESLSAGIVQHIVEDGGAKPGETCHSMGNAGPALLGALFSAIPAETRMGLATHIDRCTGAAICPVIVGLIGPAGSGRPDRYSIAWPMLLPLAPYLEWVLRKADPLELVQ
jgi:hypothetical protein